MLKKVMGFALAFIMVFTFAACNSDLSQYKTDAKAEITNLVEMLSADNYTTKNWALIGQKTNEGKVAIDAAKNISAVDTAKVAAIKAINEVLTKNDEAGDFILTISTKKASFNKDEEIKIEISLKNQSGDDLEIAYYFLIIPHIPTATDYPAMAEMPPEPYKRNFLKDEIIQMTNDLGGYFDLGRHEIKYKATFYLDFGESNESQVEIWSNTVIIVVG